MSLHTIWKSEVIAINVEGVVNAGKMESSFSWRLDDF